MKGAATIHPIRSNVSMHRLALPEGFRVGDCEIRQVAASSDVGISYQGWNRKLGRRVTIREYLPAGLAIRRADGQVAPKCSSVAGDFSDTLQQFLNEAHELAGFRHPNMVRVLHVLEDNGTGYAVTEHIEGEALSKVLQRSRVLESGEFDTTFQHLLRCLEGLHDRGLLHLDIRPSNVFVGADRSPVLYGFGAAKPRFTAARQAFRDRTGCRDATRTTSVYSPVEMYASHARRGPWTDIYSLAATMYHCVTGTPPSAAPERVIHDEDTSLAGGAMGTYRPGTLAGIEAALSIRPEDRPASVAVWRDMLAGAGREDHLVQANANLSPLARTAARGARLHQPGRPETSIARSRRPRWSIPALALTGASALVAYVDTGILRSPADRDAAVTGPMAMAPTLDGSALVLSRQGSRSQESIPTLSPMSRLATRADRAALIVNTDPPQVDVFVAGRNVGRTPLKLWDQPTGSFDVVLRHPHYETIRFPNQSFDPGKGVMIQQSLARATGNLRVTTEPPGAWVEWNGQRVIERTPGVAQGLPAGPIELTIGIGGRRSFKVFTEVPKDDTGYLARTLRIRAGP